MTILFFTGTRKATIKLKLNLLKTLEIDVKIKNAFQTSYFFKEYDHIFSSENCQYAIDCIHENYSPRILYGDIQKRNVKNTKISKKSWTTGNEWNIKGKN